MHEIITLQLGQLSNYAATHFWNTQESYFTYSDQDESLVNHNVHWRPGVALNGTETFLPRTVIYDLKGGFGSLRKINALYDASQDSAPTQLWLASLILQTGTPDTTNTLLMIRDGSPHVHNQPQIDQSAYQRSLDQGTPAPTLTTSDVRYWSDFSRVFYHPKSLNQLYDYELNSSIMPFDKWSLGRELFDTLDKEHDIVDRDFRPFVEEADQMQGLQIVTTIDDAWGGFATEYVEKLRDEYGKAAIWVWGLQSPMPAARIDQKRLQMSNTARTVKDLSENASMLVPMALPQTGLSPNICIDRQSPWQSTALLATAIETAGLATRLHAVTSVDLKTTLADLAGGLNLRGKQTISRLQMSIAGLPSDSAVDLPTFETTHEGGGTDDNILDTNFFDMLRVKPAASRGRNRTGDVPHFFGHSITTRGLLLPVDNADSPMPRPRAALVETSTQRFHTDKRFPILDSFPRILVEESGRTPFEDLAVKTSLSTDTSVSVAMRTLRTAVAWTIDLEDREDISNELADLEEAYREGWSSGSDDGDD